MNLQGPESRRLLSKVLGLGIYEETGALNNEHFPFRTFTDTN